MKVSQQLTIPTLAAIVIIALVAVSAWVCVVQLTDSDKGVFESASKLEALQELCYHLAYTSAAQRAYLITGFDSSLDLYHSELDSTNKTLQRLQEMVSANPDQKALAAQLQAGLSERLASLETTLGLYETKGQAVAFERIKQGKGLAMMAHTVELANELRASELRLLDQRRIAAETSASNTKLTVVLGSLLAIVIIALANLFHATKLSNTLGHLLRSSQNLAHGRFESLVDVRSDDEISDLGRAFNTLAGLLQEKSAYVDQAKASVSAAEADLASKDEMLKNLRQQVNDLALLIHESSIEQDSASSHQKQLVRHVSDLVSLSQSLNTSLTQILDLSRESRIAAETTDRKSNDLSEEVSKLSDQALCVVKALETVFSNLPETKDLVTQLEGVDNQLAVLDVVSSMNDTKESAASQPTVINTHLKAIRQSLCSIKSKLNINVSYLQQSSKQALDASATFAGSLKEADKPLALLSLEVNRFLAPSLSMRSELTNLERLHLRQANQLDEIGRHLSSADASAGKQKDFLMRLELRAGAAQSTGTQLTGNGDRRAATQIETAPVKPDQPKT